MAGDFKETHRQGVISIENVPVELEACNVMRGDFGVQVAEDGRVWICINGIAYLRFSPQPDGEMSKQGAE